ncbi:hypothetical protein FISHEDRAFT_59506 [Fistulina hepatica ATCC 64428]|uniref:Myb/SANT-like domain-containing protein n=1 Tax=Fistulina hepatica ATCC 64428 TaxID=1128425 RepID=A0A0D7A9F8_9AGAR|nr:hypothetical protein FISHEDRAFT_59506 [Fistulina hepatica ATCC 64428]
MADTPDSILNSDEDLTVDITENYGKPDASAHWTDKETAVLLNSLVVHKSEAEDGGNFTNPTYQKVLDTAHLCHVMKGGPKTIKVLQNKIALFQSTYFVVCAVRNNSGWAWDDKLGANISQPEQYSTWQEYVAHHKKAKPFKNRGWAWLPKMDALFDSTIAHGGGVFHPGRRGRKQDAVASHHAASIQVEPSLSPAPVEDGTRDESPDAPQNKDEVDCELASVWARDPSMPPEELNDDDTEDQDHPAKCLRATPLPRQLVSATPAQPLTSSRPASSRRKTALGGMSKDEMLGLQQASGTASAPPPATIVTLTPSTLSRCTLASVDDTTLSPTTLQRTDATTRLLSYETWLSAMDKVLILELFEEKNAAVSSYRTLCVNVEKDPDLASVHCCEACGGTNGLSWDGGVKWYGTGIKWFWL